MTRDSTLAASVIGVLRERGQTLATAESLTGGLLGAALTAVPGASQVYLGGVVSYATRLKHEVLGVADADIERFSVISPQVALAMASGVWALTGADWAVATTGVAGPEGQDGHAPGEVWIAVCGRTPGRGDAVQEARAFTFAGGRCAVRDATVAAGLVLLLEVLAPV